MGGRRNNLETKIAKEIGENDNGEKNVEKNGAKPGKKKGGVGGGGVGGLGGEGGWMLKLALFCGGSRKRHKFSKKNH